MKYQWFQRVQKHTLPQQTLILRLLASTLCLLCIWALLLCASAPAQAQTNAYQAQHKHPRFTPTPSIAAGTQTGDPTLTPSPVLPPLQASPGLTTTLPYPQLYITPGGTSYYVSPSGNDANNGSLDQPFATIQKAATVVTPGSVVHVLPGTYTGPITIQTSGTAQARIAFVSDTKWAAQITTSDSSDPWNTRADYIDIIGFDISSTGSRDGIVNFGSYTRTIANHIHNIPGGCDSTGGSGVTDGGYTSHDNAIIANVVNNIGSTYPHLCQYVHGIYHSNAGGQIINNISYDNAGCGINLWHAANATVVANNLTFGNQEHGISIGTNTPNTNGVLGDNFIVSNNISINNALLGIRERKGVGPHNQYLNNIVYGNGTAAFGDENYTWPSSAGSRDVNTITQNPQFIQYTSTSAGDYHLQSTSPAIGAGTTTGAPPIDFDGTPRSQTTIDIGPFLYVSNQITPTTTPATPTAPSTLPTAPFTTPPPTLPTAPPSTPPPSNII